MIGALLAAGVLGGVVASSDPNLDLRPGTRDREVPRVAFTNAPDGHARANGRLWITRPMIGPGLAAPRLSSEEPGPAAYGVPEGDRTRILVRVGHVQFGISPWQRIEGRAFRSVEAARNRWLHDRGFTGGVRTFVNDAVIFTPRAEAQVSHEIAPVLADAGSTPQAQPQEAGDAEITPSAVIRIPEEMPRFRKRMQVRGAEAPAALPAPSPGPSVGTFAGGKGSGRHLVMPKIVPANQQRDEAIAKDAQPADAPAPQADTSPAARG